MYNSELRKETGKDFYKCSRIIERFDLAIDARYFSLPFTPLHESKRALRDQFKSI